MAKLFFVLLVFVFAAYGQEEQKRVAILRTVDDGSPEIEPTELIHLTVKLREIAGNVLQKHYGIMTEQSIIDKLGGKDIAVKACKEAEGCLAQLGRKINADYIGQARLGRIGGSLTISVELYNSGSGLAIHTISGESKDVFGLLKILNKKAPEMFKKMPGISSGRIIEPGIGGLTKGKGYELDEEKRYVVNLNTEPQGAVLSFDGMPAASCPKTPCNVELREGSVRIIASLDQYEIADTSVSINQNYQGIAIRLKPNFGILDIKPAYLENIGRDRQWSLSLNNKPYSLGEIRLSPNKYVVRLGHECYENIGFDVGINKGSRDVFDMAGNITLKKGGLVLSTERNREPISEPVFVNGKQIGETPFSGAIPLCAKVEVGKNRDMVNVKLKHNEKVNYKIDLYSSTPRTAGSYTPASDAGNSLLVAIALDIIGAVVIYAGYLEHEKMWAAYDEYKERGLWQSSYDRTWKNMESHLSKRNILYTVGGVFLASGIGVHIWF